MWVLFYDSQCTYRCISRVVKNTPIDSLMHLLLGTIEIDFVIINVIVMIVTVVIIIVSMVITINCN